MSQKKPVVYNNKKTKQNKFHIEFTNGAQKMAWGAFQQHDILFLTGPAGVGKSFLAMAFAISELLENKAKKIILTRPIVQAGEDLGFLPGDFMEKVNPYMAPLYDSLDKLISPDSEQSEFVKDHIEIAPLAYLRGRSFDNAICIFDEAQNATLSQIKLFVTRFGANSKIIITGDPNQSDIHNSGLMNVVSRLETVGGVGIIRFKNDSIVRHPLISEVLDKLEE